MFGIFLYDILFLVTPLVLIVFWGISLYRYLSAKKKNKQVPGTFLPEEIKNRKMIFIVLSVISAIFLAVVIGFIVLLFMAVAFM